MRNTMLALSALLLLGCGGSSDNSQLNTPTQLLNKEVRYDDNGNIFETITYTYNNKNQLSSSTAKGDQIDETCTYKSNNKNLLISENCIDQGEKRDTKYIYINGKLSRLDTYIGGVLRYREKVTAWSSNKPKIVKFLSYDSNNNEEVIREQTLTYTGKNPTHIEETYANSIHVTYDRKYDSYKTPYNNHIAFGSSIYWHTSENNIIEEKTTDTNGAKILIEHKITYNSNNFPTKIIYNTTGLDGNGQKVGFTESKYTKFEYKNSK